MRDGAGREVALACLDFLDEEPGRTVRAAAAAGCTLVTLRVAGSATPVRGDVGADPQRLAQVRSELAATGVGVLDVEVLRMTPWLAPDDVARAVELAAVLGARHLLVVNASLPQAAAVDLLGRVAEAASAHGARACLEPMAFSACRDLDTAVATAVPAGAAVLVDALHLHRAGQGPADVRRLRAEHGPDLFPYLQLCDALWRPPADGEEALRREALVDRLLPGTGDLPLPALLEAVSPTAPVVVEAPVRELAGLSPEERAHRAVQAVRRVLRSSARPGER